MFLRCMEKNKTSRFSACESQHHTALRASRDVHRVHKYAKLYEEISLLHLPLHTSRMHLSHWRVTVRMLMPKEVAGYRGNLASSYPY